MRFGENHILAILPGVDLDPRLTGRASSQDHCPIRVDCGSLNGRDGVPSRGVYPLGAEVDEESGN